MTYGSEVLVQADARTLRLSLYPPSRTPTLTIATMATIWRIALTFATTLALMPTASAFSVAPVPRSSSQWPALSSPLFQKKGLSTVRALESSVVVSTNSAADSPAPLRPVASAMTKVCWILDLLEDMHVKRMIYILVNG